MSQFALACSPGATRRFCMPKKVESIPRPLLRRPSTQRYRMLISQLADSHDRLKQGNDPLEEAVASIRAILRFVGSDPALKRQPPIAPLANLHAALVDVSRGARPPLLQPAPRVESDKSPTKPTNLFRDEMRALLAGALDFLMRYAGEQRLAAAEWLAAECGKQEILDDKGHSISARQIAKWRDNAKGRIAPEATLRTYDLLVSRHAEKTSAGLYRTPADAREQAATIVLLVANHNSHLPSG